MALLNEDGMGTTMLVSPTNGMGNAFGGDNSWWIILFFIILMGGYGYGGYGYGNGGAVDSTMQRGFDQAALTSGIGDLQTSLTAGFAGVNQGLCSGFANVQNGFAQAEIAANARQMADMNQNFALQQQFSQCCCDNRLATANLQADIARENCADRQAVTDALVAVTNQMNAGFQALHNEFFQDRLDQKDAIIADLQARNNEMSRQASQNAQTAALIANNEAQTAALKAAISPSPIPSYTVPNPYAYSQNYGCGCGCGSLA